MPSQFDSFNNTPTHPQHFTFHLGLKVQEMSWFVYESNESAIPFLAPAGLDIGAISDDPSGPPQPVSTRGPRQLQEEPLDVILSPELDKMVTDGENPITS